MGHEEDGAAASLAALALRSRQLGDFREHALEQIAKRVGASGGYWASYPFRSGPSLACLGHEPGLPRRLASARYRSENAEVFAKTMRVGGVARDQDLVSAAEKERLAAWREQLLPAGVAHTLLAVVEWPSGQSGLCLTRGPGPAFEASAVRRLACLRPILALAEERLHVSQKPGPTSGRLSRREAEIAALAARGLTNPEIGGVLGISPLSVRNRLTAVYEKLEIAGRTELSRVLGED